MMRAKSSEPLTMVITAGNVLIVVVLAILGAGVFMIQAMSPIVRGLGAQLLILLLSASLLVGVGIQSVRTRRAGSLHASAVFYGLLLILAAVLQLGSIGPAMWMAVLTSYLIVWFTFYAARVGVLDRTPRWLEFAVVGLAVTFPVLMVVIARARYGLPVWDLHVVRRFLAPRAVSIYPILVAAALSLAFGRSTRALSELSKDGEPWRCPECLFTNDADVALCACGAKRDDRQS